MAWRRGGGTLWFQSVMSPAGYPVRVCDTVGHILSTYLYLHLRGKGSRHSGDWNKLVAESERQVRLRATYGQDGGLAPYLDTMGDNWQALRLFGRCCWRSLFEIPDGVSASCILTTESLK